MSAPLAGLLVVDLSRHLPGPLAARILADLGARVVKVEEPTRGDPVRGAPPFASGRSALAALLLSGVESVALDLKRPAGREVLLRLLAGADVLLETFRPGTLARLGLAPDDLRARFPRLVVCSLSGWGADGPWAGRAGHDLTYQAVAGMLAPASPPGSPPAVPVADLLGAWSAVAAVQAALLARERTGSGAWIDAALYDAAVHGNLTSWAEEAGRESGVGEPLALTGALPCYHLYETADGGWLALAALEPHFWQRFCDAAGRGDLASHQFSSSPRVRRALARLVRGRTRAQWAELLAGADVPAEPVLAASAAREHPQARSRGVLAAGPEGLPRLGFPARIDGERPRSGDAFPALGEHTESLLAELGAPEAALSRRARREAGIGPRVTRRERWRAAVGRWAAAAAARLGRRPGG